MFGKPFPFEGNWNSHLATTTSTLSRSESLSRLKGIETKGPWWPLLLLHMFGKPFPFEGNWNLVIDSDYGIEEEKFGKPFPFEGNWNSRRSTTCLTITSFGKPFPFEGNWNPSPPRTAPSRRRKVRKAFPVWRELKLYRPSTVCFVICQVRKAFPVWRELKHTGLPLVSWT